jgi:hypothetical protein
MHIIVGYWCESHKEREHWEDQDVSQLVDNIKVDLGEIGLDWSGSGNGAVEEFCGRGNEPSGSIK